MRAAPFQRDLMLVRLEQEEFDILIVGAGITGVGAALDAASRGPEALAAEVLPRINQAIPAIGILPPHFEVQMVGRAQQADGGQKVSTFLTQLHYFL